MKRIASIAAIFSAIAFSAFAAEEAKVKVEEVTYKVTGMTCAACEGKVSKALAGLDGVTVKKVSSKSEKAAVTFDPKKVKKADILAAIKGTGFKVEGEKVSLKVTGMSCGACSGKVTKALAGLDGVLGKEVSHKDGTAVVVFDPKKTDRKKIVAVINGTNFKVKE